MIELRWVERTVLCSNETGEEWEEVERVLQYRQRVGTHHDGWWADWIEVPTVREE